VLLKFVSHLANLAMRNRCSFNMPIEQHPQLLGRVLQHKKCPPEMTRHRISLLRPKRTLDRNRILLFCSNHFVQKDTRILYCGDGFPLFYNGPCSNKDATECEHFARSPRVCFSKMSNAYTKTQPDAAVSSSLTGWGPLRSSLRRQ
jgi:hypothetical protein